MSVEEIRIVEPTPGDLREAAAHYFEPPSSDPSNAQPTTPGANVPAKESAPESATAGGTTKMELRPVSADLSVSSVSSDKPAPRGVKFAEVPGAEKSPRESPKASTLAIPGGPMEVNPSGSVRISARGGQRISAYPGRQHHEAPQQEKEKKRRTINEKLQASKFYHSPTASKLRACLHGKTFVILMTLALFVALFLPEIWVLCGANSNLLVDIILTWVMVMFIVEFFLLSLLDATYFLSFFFVMDIVGTVSMIFDISYMIGLDHTMILTRSTSDSGTKNNLMLLRAARAARVGARAGRLSKVLRILRFLPFLSAGKDDQTKGIAGSISRQLANLLAIRVACLTIILVMVIPLFDILSFPQHDHSLQTWVERLSADKDENSAMGEVLFRQDINAMVSFFEKRVYGPYKACVGSPVGDDEFVCDQDVIAHFTHEAPDRGASALWVHTKDFMVGFNMHETQMVDKGLAMVNIFFIIIIMVFSGLALSNVVTELAVRPLERMLKTVREIAEQVFKMSTGLVEEEEEADEEFDINSSTEMRLLEKVVAKLAIIAALQENAGAPQAEEGMGDEDIGVLNMMQGQDVLQNRKLQAIRRASVKHAAKQNTKSATAIQLTEVGITDAWYNNSNLFNTLQLNKTQLATVGIYAISRFHEDVFIATESEKQLLTRFVWATEKEYNMANPFHNFFHAIDVLHGTAKMMRLMNSESFLTELEQYCLLVAAIGHDIGHPGVNNGFLSEVGHELALQYNDLSPLENMHVSKLYGILVVEETNVFNMLTKEQYKEVRKLCIETILHTDMMGHTAMVKDLTMMFQLNAEIFSEGGTVNMTPEVVDILIQPDHKLLIMENILHSADVSNPARGWEVTQAWADCVLNEFFAQGDQEKMLGVPVQMLNNRDEVNKPWSQIGFLEFLIVPFFAAQIKIFYGLSEYGDHLQVNIVRWEEMWVEEKKPEDEARAKLRARVEKIISNLEEAKQTSAPLFPGTNSINLSPA